MGNAVCGPGKPLNAESVGGGGISGKSSDIDDAALQAIKGGIGEAGRAALKQNL